TNVVSDDSILTLCKSDIGAGLCHDVWRNVNGSKVSDGTINQVIEIELPQTLSSGAYQLRLEDSDQTIIESVFFTIKSNEITIDKPSFTISENVTAGYDLPAEAQDEFQICTQAQLDNPDQNCSKTITVDEFASTGSYRVARQGTFSLPASEVGIGDYKIAYEKDNNILATSDLFSITEEDVDDTIIELEVVSGTSGAEQCSVEFRSGLCASFSKDSNILMCKCGSNRMERGIHVQTITKAGIVLSAEKFDVYVDNGNFTRLNSLMNYINNVQDGDIVLMAVADASMPYWMPNRSKGQEFYNLMETKFSASLVRGMVFRKSYAGIFIAGGSPIDEAIGGDYERVVVQGSFVVNP
ncbi:hypothetical protein MNBD_UNCLBAC01-446, partial [hydrothermal vent metagenome]